MLNNKHYVPLAEHERTVLSCETFDWKMDFIKSLQKLKEESQKK